MTTRRFFRSLPVPLLGWRRVLGPLLLLASALATGIAAPPVWGQLPPDYSRDPVLFVHGYGDTGDIWDWDLNGVPGRGLITFLKAQGYPAEFLRAITFPNPTESNVTLAENQIACEIEAFLKDVNDAFPGLQKTKVDVVSHSMGGLSTRWYISQPRSAQARCDQVPTPPPPPLLGAERVDTWISLAGANHGTSLGLTDRDPPGFCNPDQRPPYPPLTVAATELCPAFIQAPAEVEDQVQLTLNGPGGFKNAGNNKDETPYGLGQDGQVPPRVMVSRVPPDASRRVFYATIRCQEPEDVIILPNDSTVVDGAGGRRITTLPANFSETWPGNFQMPSKGTNNCHELIYRYPDVWELVARLLGTTAVNFDTPAPEHGPGPLDGVFEGIDFGTGQWAWEGPFNVDPTNNIYFNDSSGTSRTFQFSPAPRLLTFMRVYSATRSGTLTLSDDRGQTLTQAVTTGSMQPVTTGWTLPSTTVTVSFTSGWDLGIDDITYRW